ncbi:sugar ABC transporter substrate-binding protein [Crassaminicella profunda]|uniref:sugar ABC transporter substrate-binding protein n=1 Tax=Crassaminicella profunda TaxID=1286698 RepID=UPI001CA672A1|nr:substrate-binding domain-containing protein [Crassaminicella profunda]QZY55646.1 substrate-binding domain-containing protein [Crassaminicella profunda]
MKKYVLFLIFLLMIVTILLRPQSIYNATNPLSYIKNKDYHFIFIPKEENDYWDKISKGIVVSANENNVSVSILKINYFNKEKHLSRIDRAIESDCDGIISYTLNDNDYKNLVNKSIERNIPFITIDGDVLDSKRNAYIGINHYYAGNMMAEKLFEVLNDHGEIGLIMSSEENTLRLTGIYNKANEYEKINIIDVSYMDEKKVNTYKIIEDMVIKNKNIKGIICNDEYSTYLAGQVLVRLNKVGKIKIIGMGGMQGTKRFVQKGVIEGVFIKNPYSLGNKAIESIIDIKKGNFVEDAVFDDLLYIDKENLDEE